MKRTNAQPFATRMLGIALLLLPLALLVVIPPNWRARGQGGSLGTVSAASYAPLLAPDSIAATFGARLATRTEVATSQPLPTTLAGTTVKINGVAAPLLFVSPNQINYLIPSGTASGAASLMVTAGDGSISMGEVMISAVAPAIFTANASGSGLPAAVLLRVADGGAQTYEPISQLNPATGSFAPIPITWKTARDQVFLILYLSGSRGAVDINNDGNLNDAVRVTLGGQEVTPTYVGKSADFAGLDQINVEIPRSLGGRGAISVAVSYATQTVSNVVSVEVGGAPASAVTVNSFSPATVYVGDEITINGSGFAPAAADNQVFVVEATEQRPYRATKLNVVNANQLKAIVPFGAGSGTIKVGAAVGAAKLTLHTSVSGFVETTQNQPLPGVTVRLRGTTISTVTDAEGKFILRDAPLGLQFVEIITNNLPLPFPSLTAKVQVLANRDLHLDRIPLQQITGPSLAFDPPASFAPDLGIALAAPRTIETGGVTFEVDDTTTAIFPDGVTSRRIFLDLVERSRTPLRLPPGIFSSTIIQLTPFGVRLTPGGRLIFPNSDNLPANQAARLYKLDQTTGSATLGEFIVAGTAQVSADGRTVTTAPNAITETSYYFVAIPRPVTALFGRVVDSDGRTPVGEALVSARSRSVFTNSLGEFLLPDIAVSGANDQVTIEASYQRPDGRVDRALPRTVAPVVNGVMRVTPDLVLTSPATNPNRPPTIIAPPSLSVTEGVTLDTDFVVSDPDAGQTIQVTVSGAPFASVSLKSGNVYTLRLTPGAGTAGSYTLAMKATDNQGASTTQMIPLTVIAAWLSKASMPTARCCVMVEVVNGQLHVMGGQIGCCDINNSPAHEVYDPASNSWSIKAPLLQPRNAGGAAVIGGKIYVAGGRSGTTDLASLEVYDPATNIWTSKRSMPSARRFPTVEAVNGLLYVIGGTRDPVTDITAVEVYDPAADSWIVRSPMPTARSAMASGVINGKIYVVGGVRSVDVAILNKLEIYDPATNSWLVDRSPMITARAYAGAGVIGGDLYVVTGCLDNDAALTSALEIYSPATDFWRSAPAIPTARNRLGEAGIINGRLYVAGGWTGPLVSVTNLNVLEVLMP